jgi:hypothetical protein
MMIMVWIVVFIGALIVFVAWDLLSDFSDDVEVKDSGYY